MHNYYLDLFLFHLLGTETSMMVVLLWKRTKQFLLSLLKLSKTVNFFSFKGMSFQSCAIAECKNMCGTAAKCMKSLKGVYEIDDLWVHLQDTEVETLKVCNVHYNRDQRHHQKFSGPRHSLANMPCSSCSKSMKTTQAFPCNQHLIGLPKLKMEHLLIVQYLAAFLQNVPHRIQRLLKMNICIQVIMFLPQHISSAWTVKGHLLN